MSSKTTEHLVIPDIKKVVQPYINDGKIAKVHISRLTAPGENYVSLVYQADFEVVDNDGKSETVSAVAKRLPTAPKTREFDFHAMAMKNEIEWYSKIVPLYQNFAKKHGLDCDYFPTYLGSRLSLDRDSHEAGTDAVLLVKNLRSEGYVNEDRHVGFDLETAKSVLKSLAAFHGTGFGIKYKNPEQFQVIKNVFENGMPKPPPDEHGSRGPPPDEGPPEELVLEKILKLPEFQQFKSQLENIKNNQLPLIERYTAGGLEPWNTVTHGDFWGNNIMVAKGGESETAAVKILDFQVCRYLTYARDVIFFMLTSLKDDVLRQHLDYLLRFYYEELTTVLDKIGITELNISYESFMEELNRVVLKHEALHSLFFSVIIFAPKNNIPDHLTGEVDLFEQMKRLIDNLNARQKERLALVLETCADKGWI